MIINCNGKILDFGFPRVMAICNITSDSFYSGSRTTEERTLLEMVSEHLDEGADIIDIGGMSSRPGAKEIPLEEEINKVTWAMGIIQKEFPDCLISVDTYRSGVVRCVGELGANIINDISGGELDNDLLPSVAKFNIPYVLMHMKGMPKTMQKQPKYKEGVVLYLLNYFKYKLNECRNLGIKDIIIDPGFGFGKTVEDNYKLLGSLESFSLFDVPTMVGLSRKSLIYKIIEAEPGSAINGTTAVHMLALMNGANLLRVHDVKEAKECISLYEQYRSV